MLHPVEQRYLGFGGGRDEIWAYGLRAPWRFSFDRVTGDCWLGDNGQVEFEEVNLIRRGATPIREVGPLRTSRPRNERPRSIETTDSRIPSLSTTTRKDEASSEELSIGEQGCQS